MKSTKILLGLLIGALVLGFASCKQEVQDVKVVDQNKTQSKYYYTISGTYNANSSAAAETVTGYAYVSWDSYRNQNGTEYTISGKYNHKLDTATTYTTTGGTTLWINLYKIGGKYYIDDTDATSGEAKQTDVSSRITGNVEGTFTYTVAATATAPGYAFTFTKR